MEVEIQFQQDIQIKPHSQIVLEIITTSLMPGCKVCCLTTWTTDSTPLRYPTLGLVRVVTTLPRMAEGVTATLSVLPVLVAATTTMPLLTVVAVIEVALLQLIVATAINCCRSRTPTRMIPILNR